MIRAVTRLAAVTSLSLVTLGAWQQPQYRGGTHTVSIWATVLDREGRLVTGLDRGDFDVYDDGVRQDVWFFLNDLQPITIVIMLDRSGSMTRHFSLVRDAAGVFVEHLLPEDRARIGSFSNRIQIDPQDFTSDRAELRRILQEELQDPGPTPLWNATSAAMNALGSQAGRRVVLVFTDGEDTPGVGRNVTFGDLRARVEIEDVMVYGIGLADRCGERSAAQSRFEGNTPGFQRGPRTGPTPGGGRGLPPGGRGPGGGRGPIGGRPGPPMPGVPPTVPGLPWPGRVPSPEPFAVNRSRCADLLPDPDLRRLAEAGGGGYFELDSTADLNQAFARVADELHQQYLLAFDPKTIDNRVHQLDVRVTRPGLTARARRSYVAGAQDAGAQRR